MKDPLDTPPQGFNRANKGWLIRPVSSMDKKVKKQQEENAALRSALDAVLARLEELESK